MMPSNVTSGAPPIVPPVTPESTAAKPRVALGRDNDYLMRQATRIIQNGGTQADVVKYWQDVEGVKLALPVTLPDEIKAKGTKWLGYGGNANANNMTMHVVQGVTWGFGDEAAGSLLGLLTGEGASNGIDIYREALKQGHDLNAGTANASEILGGLASGAAIGKMLGLGVKAAKMTTAGRVALTAGEGAAGGAVAGGASASGGLSERAQGAVVGGLAGLLTVGVLAGAGQVAGSVAKPLVRGLTNWSKTLQEATPGNLSASATGRQILADALQRDGLDVTAALQKVDKMAATGAPVTIADVGGENVLQLFAAAAGLRGPAKQKLVEDFTTRQAEQGPRLLGSLFRSLKLGSENAYDAADKVFAERAAAATPLYQQSYTLEFAPGPATKKLLNEPWAKQAWEIGRNIAGEEDRAGLARVAGAKAVPLLEAPATALAVPGFGGRALPPGTTLPAALPVRGLDYLKRGLDALREARGGEGAAILDRQAWVARGELLRNALDEVGQQHPVYGQARSVWQGSTEAMEALQLGKGGGMLRRGMGEAGASFHTKPPEVITRELAKLTSSEQEMYRLGAFQDMSEWVHNMNSEAPNVAAGKFGGRVFSTVEKAMGQRLRALVHDPDVAQQLMDHVMAEARISYTTPKITQGSRTAPLASAMQDLSGEMPSGGIMRQIAGTVIQPLIARAKTGWTDAVSDELSNLATKGIGGSDELRSMLLSLNGMAPTHRPALAITAGSAVARR